MNAADNADNGATYQYPDRDVLRGVTYYYQLRQVDQNGESSLTEVREALLPDNGQLDIAIYPQPVRDIVHMEFGMTASAVVRVDIFAVNGQQLVTSREFALEAGAQKIDFDLSDVADGMYLGRIYIDGQSAGTVKFVKAD